MSPLHVGGVRGRASVGACTAVRACDDRMMSARLRAMCSVAGSRRCHQSGTHDPDRNEPPPHDAPLVYRIAKRPTLRFPVPHHTAC